MDVEIAGKKDALSIRELEAQITELAGHLNAGNYRWLKLIAEFDRRNGWVGLGRAILRALAQLQMRH